MDDSKLEMYRIHEFFDHVTLGVYNDSVEMMIRASRAQILLRRRMMDKYSKLQKDIEEGNCSPVFILDSLPKE